MTLHETGIDYHGVVSIETLHRVFSYLDYTTGASNWQIGDAILATEEAMGVDEAWSWLSQVCIHIGEPHLMVCRRIADMYPHATRNRPGLRWTHYRLVSTKKVTPEQRDELLGDASAAEQTTEEFRLALSDHMHETGQIEIKPMDLSSAIKAFERLLARWPQEHNVTLRRLMADAVTKIPLEPVYEHTNS